MTRAFSNVLVALIRLVVLPWEFVLRTIDKGIIVAVEDFCSDNFGSRIRPYDVVWVARLVPQ